ncbi:C-X-C chemokine receptor type 1 [Megalops cyprinoides]|uniref:C-X-C chemokine receptor type 1 n=1 Tax=Megalops cyprinoides TaxID=118141 RepID=UPI0018648DE9|nr:C-X-C chemokine receptor type 1 [Megalops cyprinoides]
MHEPNLSNFVITWDEDLFSNYSDYNISEAELDKSVEICLATSISPAVHIAVCTFYILIFLLAIPGNLVVGLVIGSRKQALSPSDVYLLNLAAADTLLALTLPLWATALVRGWVFGDFTCKLVSLVQEVTFYSSILFLACISVDRYLVIVRAMETRKQSRRLCSAVMSAAIWVAGAVFALPVLYNEVFLPPGAEQMVCAEQYDPVQAQAWRFSTRMLRHTLGFLLPLAVMLLCYGVTVARLLRTRGFQKQRAMRVIVAVVAAFLLCWTPYHVSVMADTLMRAKLVNFGCGARRAVDRALFGTQSLGLLHCCVNPVLYAFIGEKFRRNMLLLLCRKKVRERGSGSRISRSTSQTSEANSTLM